MFKKPCASALLRLKGLLCCQKLPDVFTATISCVRSDEATNFQTSFDGRSRRCKGGNEGQLVISSLDHTPNH